MTDREMAKAYDFKTTEKRLYDCWEKKGYFKPSSDPTKPDFDPNVKPFVIAIPPPNVTGELHLGHAMFVSDGRSHDPLPSDERRICPMDSRQ